MTAASRIVLCAKSRWDPPIRREHGLATTLVAEGHRVDFLERARDIRDLDPRRWWPPTAPPRSLPPGLVVRPQFTPVPGHRSPLAGTVDAAILRRLLRRTLATGPTPTAVVVNAPWNWPATSALPAGVRRVHDIGDDWSTLLPQRRDRIMAYHRQIAAEADAIVVVAPGLADLFDRPVHVVPNAVAPELLATAPVPPPGERRMTYVGTLSERFDSDLMGEVLRRLPDWRLDLYGPCHYAGLGAEPGPSLQRLLSESDGRVQWHGMVSRAQLSSVLDRGDVLVLPNDPAISIGQDSMKLYDYAARGRPIVATPIRLPDDGPAVIALAADAADFAAAVLDSAGRDASPNRAWAVANGWSSRLPAWLAAVEGVPTPVTG